MSATIATTNLQPSMAHADGTAPEVVHRIDAADGFKLIRGHCLKLARFNVLPHADAEDLAAELVTRELLEAASVGRPNTVRREHTRAKWVQLEARDYRRRVVDRRLAEATADGSLPELDAEDFTEREANPAPEVSPLGCWHDAHKLARRLELPDSAAPALAQGLWPGDGSELADALGVERGHWRKRVSRAAKLIRDSYPAPADLADQIELGVAKRTVKLDDRRLGAPLPPGGDRHRTAAQLAREANVLLARPQRPGRKATAASMPDVFGRAPKAPKEWASWRRTDYLLPVAVLRRIAEHLAVTDLPKSGPRPHRMSPGIKSPGYSLTREPELAQDGWSAINRADREHDRTREGWNRPDAPLSRRTYRSARRLGRARLAQVERATYLAEHRSLSALIARVRGDS